MRQVLQSHVRDPQEDVLDLSAGEGSLPGHLSGRD